MKKKQSAIPLFTGSDALYPPSFIAGLKKAMTSGRTKADLVAIKEAFDERAERFGDATVAVANVHTDQYQRHSEADERELAAKAVVKIAKAFNPKALGVVTIGTRNDVALALDGVHRLILARVVGAELVPAIIEEVNDIGEEARIYATLNAGRRSVSSHSKARSQSLIDPNSDDRKLANILARIGRSVVTKDIGGVDMAKRMIRWQGERAFELGITLHEECWPDASIKPEVAAAFGEIVTTYDLTESQGERLIEIVTNTAANPTQMLNAVPVDGLGHRHGIKRVRAMTDYLVKQMNVGVRGSARLDPEALPWSATAVAAAAKAKAEALKAKEDARKAKAEARKAKTTKTKPTKRAWKATEIGTGQPVIVSKKNKQTSATA